MQSFGVGHNTAHHVSLGNRPRTQLARTHAQTYKHKYTYIYVYVYTRDKHGRSDVPSAAPASPLIHGKCVMCLRAYVRVDTLAHTLCRRHVHTHCTEGIAYTRYRGTYIVHTHYTGSTYCVHAYYTGGRTYIANTHVHCEYTLRKARTLHIHTTPKARTLHIHTTPNARTLRLRILQKPFVSLS